MEEKIGVVGLGYVGLPVALALAKAFPGTVGFDVNRRRVETLTSGVDESDDVPAEELRGNPLRYTSNPEDLRGSSFFVVAVPTPVDENHTPDLTALVRASATVGKVIQRGAVVVYESTVYPGVTQEICGAEIERVSGLKAGVDFHLGYSPERINPGDREHTLERITKVVSGDDAATLDRVASVYASIVPAGIHRAPSIMVAEAAKVIENTQRDLNIALMNELAIIFEKMGIATKDVLDAAATKWNFLRFSPGLVGGHCIGVDPYYLTTKAQQLGYHPDVILAGRRINDGMGAYIAQRVIKLTVNSNYRIRDARIGILGLTFKENVSDLRNSRVPDIVRELQDYRVEVLVHDPLADREFAKEEYGLDLCSWEELHDLTGIVLAVPHRRFLENGYHDLLKPLRTGGVFFDVKAAIAPEKLRKDVHYGAL